MANPKTNLKRLNCLIGQQIRFARNVRKMNMEQLGSELGITYQQLQKYETGTNRISAARLFKISQILNRPITFFYDGVIDDLTPHIGYTELKAAHLLREIIPDEILRSEFVSLMEQMSQQ